MKHDSPTRVVEDKQRQGSSMAEASTKAITIRGLPKASDAMREIMGGEASPAQVGAFLALLTLRMPRGATRRREPQLTTK
eukprot:Skav201894  [mRNA]  locus=scaffold550:848535:849229:+ [translate_table: standard]